MRQKYSNVYRQRWGHHKNKARRVNKTMIDGASHVDRRVAVPLTRQLNKILEDVALNNQTSVGLVILDAVVKRVLANGLMDYGFNLPLEVKETVANTKAAKDMFKYLLVCGSKGVDTQELYCSMLDMGINSIALWCEAYKRLLDSGSIEEFEHTDINDMKYKRKRVRVR